jgi:hypothetical protein
MRQIQKSFDRICASQKIGMLDVRNGSKADLGLKPFMSTGL